MPVIIPLCFLSFFPLDSRLLNLFNWNQRGVVASLASLVPHKDKGGVLAHSLPLASRIFDYTQGRLRKRGNPIPPVTARLCDTEEVSLPFRHREAMFFYRRGNPFRHREPADFAGVAASVSKTEIATLTKYKSVRSQCTVLCQYLLRGIFEVFR